MRKQNSWVICQGHTAVRGSAVYVLVYCVFDLQKQHQNGKCVHLVSWGAFLALSFKLYRLHCMWQISQQTAGWTTQILAWVDVQLFTAGAPRRDRVTWRSLLGRNPVKINKNGPDHTVEPWIQPDPKTLGLFCVTVNSFVWIGKFELCFCFLVTTNVHKRSLSFRRVKG